MAAARLGRARLLLLLLHYYLCQAAAGKANTDRAALLAFKAGVSTSSGDPSGALRSWNCTARFCRWPGVRCTRGRVTSLNVTALHLRGTISPAIGNLSSLQVLDVNVNGFSGTIPASIGRLKRLSYLGLCDNALTGEIPRALANCTGLQNLYLSRNNLTGTIPAWLAMLQNLTAIGLTGNLLFGEIPRSLENLTNLRYLEADQNLVQGQLPVGLSRLPFLQTLSFGQNGLSGKIPLGLFNMSSLQNLCLAGNGFDGNLPIDAGNHLPNLESLLLGGNQLTGHIPGTLSNASNMSYLSLSSNSFSGHVPPDIGTLPLNWLQLSNNELTSSEAGGWEFLKNLMENCTTLQGISLGGNKLGGTIPSSLVTNISQGLQLLNLARNRIHGGIPRGVGQLAGLQTLALHSNRLTGAIPAEFGSLVNLQEMLLHGNMLAGSIPSSVANLTQLLSLNLGNNMLNGPIPPAIGHLQRLTNLNLSRNALSGHIPTEIFALSSLSTVLDLSSNQLRGALPPDVGQLRSISVLAVSNNHLSDEIPRELGSCQSLEFLDLDGNLFTGSISPSLVSLKGLRRLNLANNRLSGAIPPALAEMSGLQELQLSRNNLTGSIPMDLENMSSLVNLDLSYNNLTGRVPIHGVFANMSRFKIVGNAALCGGITLLHLSPCLEPSHQHPSNRFLEIALPTLATALLFIIIFTILRWRKRKIGAKDSSAFGEAIEKYPRVSYVQLARATDGFASTNLIGTGKYGHVYRGILPLKAKGWSIVEDITVAVKVFDLQQVGASKSFMVECEALRCIRHRNLIRIITCCSSIDANGDDFRALVFEFKQNFSLHQWLHPDSEMVNKVNGLSITQRFNIAVDIADGLHYLHTNCKPPMIHCDLKTRNVLLDEDMTASICDFGLAKLLLDAGSNVSPNSRSTIGIRGTVGYVAPEYGVTGEATTYGDVYSFGIMLLEIFSGKAPTDDIFKDGLTLHEFIRSAFPEKIQSILDPCLIPTVESDDHASAMGGCLVSTIRIALNCSRQIPSERMNMSDVAAEIRMIRDKWMSSRFQ